MTQLDNRIGRRMLWLAVLLTSAATQPVGAQDDERRYRVEVVVFRHTAPAPAGEVFRMVPVTTDAAEDAEPSLGVADLRFGRFERLAAENYDLGPTLSKLTRASRFSPLVHTGWIQPATSLEESRAKRINGSDSDARVGGRIVLSRGRYLDLDFDLTLSRGGDTYRLQQKRRRVRYGKYNYIDHPYFGVIAQVTRAPDPEPEASPTGP